MITFQFMRLNPLISDEVHDMVWAVSPHIFIRAKSMALLQKISDTQKGSDATGNEEMQ